MKKKQLRFTALIAVLVIMVAHFCGFSVNAQAEDSEKTVVVAGSDFQSTTAENGARKLGMLIESVKTNSGISSADGFLFCGDYSRTDRVMKDNAEGVKQLKSALSGFVPNQNIVLAQGNHDCEVGSAGMSPSGNNDPASNKYGVFVINESDYMWCNSDEQRIIETAGKLEEYLDEKLEEKFSAPIFIVSHLHLHASMRTQSIGDAKHANYIFDVLNSAGAQGLNIVFLFGHNHGDGWDDYLGGSSVYLAKGDEIVIAHGSMNSLTTETLNFYYLNAGYVGYYTECNEGADCTLTLTSFTFDDKTLEIARYDVHDVHELKSKGVINSYKNEDKYNYYSANTDVYTSPQVIELHQFVAPEKPSEEINTEASSPSEVPNTDPVPSIPEDEKESDPSIFLPSTVLLIVAIVLIALIVVAVVAVIILAAALVIVFVIRKKKKR